jgi:hypothetical protein
MLDCHDREERPYVFAKKLYQLQKLGTRRRACQRGRTEQKVERKVEEGKDASGNAEDGTRLDSTRSHSQHSHSAAVANNILKHLETSHWKSKPVFRGRGISLYIAVRVWLHIYKVRDRHSYMAFKRRMIPPRIHLYVIFRANMLYYLQ